MSYTPFLMFRNKAFPVQLDATLPPAMPIQVTDRPFNYIPLYNGVLTSTEIVDNVQEDVLRFLETNHEINVEIFPGFNLQVRQIVAAITDPISHSVSGANQLIVIDQQVSTSSFNNIYIAELPSKVFTRAFKELLPTATSIAFRCFDGTPTGNIFNVYAEIASGNGFVYKIPLGVGEGAAFIPLINAPIYGRTSGSRATLKAVVGDVLYVTDPSVNTSNPSLGYAQIFTQGETIADQPLPIPFLVSGIMSAPIVWPVSVNLANTNVKVTSPTTVSPS